MNRYRRSLLTGLLGSLSIAGLLSGCSGSSDQSRPLSGLPMTTLFIQGQALKVEIAANGKHRGRGLMHRDKLQESHGMLFVFPAPQPLSFWMRNTLIPLSIAFVDEHGAIINIEEMRPLNENLVHSRRPALYAIEMQQGWFTARGIRAGAHVDRLPAAAAR